MGAGESSSAGVKCVDPCMFLSIYRAGVAASGSFLIGNIYNDSFAVNETIRSSLDQNNR